MDVSGWGGVVGGSVEVDCVPPPRPGLFSSGLRRQSRRATANKRWVGKTGKGDHWPAEESQQGKVQRAGQ